jgi:hypothetical protein
MNNVLVGKLFLGHHYESWSSGIVVAAVDATHYLVRFDDLVRFKEDSCQGEPLKHAGSLAVVALSDMVKAGRGDDVPWMFFDDPEIRAKFQAYLDEPEDEHE